jgi:hypothetical protein
VEEGQKVNVGSAIEFFPLLVRKPEYEHDGAIFMGLLVCCSLSLTESIGLPYQRPRLKRDFDIKPHKNRSVFGHPAHE